MPEFINTRDTLGDQETADALIEHRISEFKDDSVYNVAAHGLRSSNTLKSVEFPRITTIAHNAMCENSNLEIVKLGGYNTDGVVDIRPQVFLKCYNLTKLIIDRPVKAIAASINIFDDTAIGKREGAIFVPSNLVNAYKTDDVWKYFLIYDISRASETIDYNNTITDSWSEILSNPNYKTDYQVGDSKTMALSNGTNVVMQIAAFDTDDKSDGSGKAKITWLCKYIYGYHQMFTSDNTDNGWPGTTMRSWLHNDILPMIPNEIQSKIVSVSKIYRLYYTSSTANISNDSIWIPSASEVGIDKLFSGLVASMGDGNLYSDYFRYASSSADNEMDITRRKSDNGVYKQWMLRTIYDPWCYCYVSPKGINDYGGAVQSVAGTVFGFCTD